MHSAQALPVQVPRGFTLIEVLIVIVVLGLLATLLVPAIQSARESARNVTCLGNLKSLGLQFTSFQANHGRFPSSVTAEVKGPLITNPKVAFRNFASELLPYAEAKSQHDAYRMEEDFCSEANAEAALVSLANSRCPSAPVNRLSVPEEFRPASLLRFFVGEANETVSQIITSLADHYECNEMRGPSMDYTVVVGITTEVAEALGYRTRRRPDQANAPYSLEGMFPLPGADSQDIETQLFRLAFGPTSFTFERGLRPSDIRDGLQRTIMMAECAGRPQLWRTNEEVIDEWATPGSVWSHPQNVIVVGGNSSQRLIQGSNDQSIYSFHYSHCNVLFADGHSRGIAWNISPDVLVALVTPQQGDRTE